MLSSRLEFLTAEPRLQTPPRWRATGEKITRAPAASPPFESPEAPVLSTGHVEPGAQRFRSAVDDKLRAKGASLVQRRAEPVRSDALLDAMREGYDTRGDMTAGGVRQAACAGGEPRWPATGLPPAERFTLQSRNRFTLRGAAAARKYAAPEPEQPDLAPSVGPLLEVSSRGRKLQEAWHSGGRRSVVAAGRRRGRVRQQAKDLAAIDDMYTQAQQTLAEQRSAIIQLSEDQQAERDDAERRRQIILEREQAERARAEAAEALRLSAKEEAEEARARGPVVGGDFNFLGQVKRRPADGRPEPAQRGKSNEQGHEQEEEERLRKGGMVVSGVAGLRQDHKKKLSSTRKGRRKGSRSPAKQRDDENDDAEDPEAWGVIGWTTDSALSKAIADTLTVRPGKLAAESQMKA